MKTKLLFLLTFLLINFVALSQDVPSFSVKIKGNGTSTAVLVPGYSCSGEVWDDLTAKYGERFTFYVITFAGFASEKPQQNPSFKKWIEDLASYITEQKLKKPVVIGHSLGGVVAMDLAAKYPLLVSKIIVVDALPSLSAMYDSTFKAADTPDCSLMVNQFVSMDDQKFYTIQEYSTRSLVADTSKIKKIMSWALKSDRKTLAQIYCQFLNYDLRAKLSSIQCPALILLEPSFKRMRAAIDEQFKLLPKKHRIIRYANSGLHFLMYDDAGWFLNEVDSFTQ